MDIKKTNRKNIVLGLSIIIFCVFADQMSKFYIASNFDFSKVVKVIDGFFHIVYVRNAGAAWSILQNQRLVLIAIPSVISLIGIIFMLRSLNKFLTVALALVISGGIGNLIDRVTAGTVIDFLEFFIFGYSFPVFNVADMCVVIGTGLLIIFILFIYKENDMAYIPLLKKDKGNG